MLQHQLYLSAYRHWEQCCPTNMLMKLEIWGKYIIIKRKRKTVGLYIKHRSNILSLFTEKSVYAFSWLKLISFSLSVREQERAQKAQTSCKTLSNLTIILLKALLLLCTSFSVFARYVPRYSGSMYVLNTDIDKVLTILPSFYTAWSWPRNDYLPYNLSNGFSLRHFNNF